MDLVPYCVVCAQHYEKINENLKINNNVIDVDFCVICWILYVI